VRKGGGRGGHGNIGRKGVGNEGGRGAGGRIEVRKGRNKGNRGRGEKEDTVAQTSGRREGRRGKGRVRRKVGGEESGQVAGMGGEGKKGINPYLFFEEGLDPVCSLPWVAGMLSGVSPRQKKNCLPCLPWGEPQSIRGKEDIKGLVV